MCVQLTSEMLLAGWVLLGELDRHKFLAKTALWLYEDERDRWSLVIATPHRRSMGARKSYKLVDKVMSKTEIGIELASVSLVHSSASWIKELSASFRRRAIVAGVRLRHTIIGDRLIDEAYIYRVAAQRPAR